MNLANAIKGGVTGATTLTLLQEALHKIDAKTPRPFLHNSGVIKKLKKSADKPKKHGALYIELAGELLGSAAYFGLAGLGKRKNAVWTGGLLGAAAGLGAAFLDKDAAATGDANHVQADMPQEELQKKLLTVALYTGGGLLAGLAIKRLNKKTLRKLGKLTRVKK